MAINVFVEGLMGALLSSHFALNLCIGRVFEVWDFWCALLFFSILRRLLISIGTSRSFREYHFSLPKSIFRA